MSERTREEKLENIIVNYSMIFMGVFEEAFSMFAEKMTEAMGDLAGGLAEALAPSSSGSSSGEDRQPLKVPPEIGEGIRHVFSEIREEVESQLPKDSSGFKEYVSSPVFDKGIEIVERYDFHRPNLTQRLSDEALASYVFLLQSGDKELELMFKELSEWQKGLPKSPWGTGGL